MPVDMQAPIVAACIKNRLLLAAKKLCMKQEYFPKPFRLIRLKQKFGLIERIVLKLDVSHFLSAAIQRTMFFKKVSMVFG